MKHRATTTDERATLEGAALMNEQASAYYRNGKIICVPCSNSEDREYPARPRRNERCSICDEPIL